MLATIAAAARRWGADLVGAAALPPPPAGSAGRDESGLEAARDMGFSWAASLAVRLSDAVLEGVRDNPTPTYAYHYLAVNRLLDEIALRVARLIEGRGHRALPVPASQTVDRAGQAGIFPHKTAAVLAGLGRVGRSALLVAPRHGPRLRLVTVLTDMPLGAAAAAARGAADAATADAACGRPAAGRHPCAGCGACVKACPAGALTGGSAGALAGGAIEPGGGRGDLVDVNRCAAWLVRCAAEVGADVCGVCVAVCPLGRAGGNMRQRRE